MVDVEFRPRAAEHCGAFHFPLSSVMHALEARLESPERRTLGERLSRLSVDLEFLLRRVLLRQTWMPTDLVEQQREHAREAKAWLEQQEGELVDSAPALERWPLAADAFEDLILCEAQTRVVCLTCGTEATTAVDGVWRCSADHLLIRIRVDC